MRSAFGHVFEKSTIELWLESNGQVCPITHETLTAEELTPDDELRSRIIRFQIQRSSAPTEEEDLYDF